MKRGLEMAVTNEVHWHETCAAAGAAGEQVSCQEREVDGGQYVHEVEGTKIFVPSGKIVGQTLCLSNKGFGQFR
jgi:hypothetical protein